MDVAMPKLMKSIIMLSALALGAYATSFVVGFYGTGQDKAKYAALQRLESHHKEANGKFLYIEDTLTGLNIVSLPLSIEKNSFGEWLVVNAPCSDGRPCILNESHAPLNCEALGRHIKHYAFDQVSKAYIRSRCPQDVEVTAQL